MGAPCFPWFGGFRTQQFSIRYHLPIRNNHPLLEFSAPLDWVRLVGQVVRCPLLVVGLLNGNLREYGDGSIVLLRLPCLLLQLLFCETSH